MAQNNVNLVQARFQIICWWDLYNILCVRVIEIDVKADI